MSKRNLLIFILLVAVAAGVYHLSRPEPVSVIVKLVDVGDVQSSVTNTRAGTVNACMRAKLAPAISGQIAFLPVKEGQLVEKDQLLLELWNEDLKARLKLAQKDAEAAKARSQEVCIAADVMVKEAKRLTRLLQKGLTSEEVADNAVGQSTAKQAACRAVKSAVSVSTANIEVANAALERTRLRAPFNGTVAEINGEVGEVVTPSPIGVATLPAVDLIDNSCLYVTAPIDEIDTPQIRVGQSANIYLDAFGKKPFDGVVRRIAPYVLDIEKQARVVDVEVEFNGTKDLQSLLPGYSADVEIILAKKDDVLRIPTEAVMEDDKVYRYDPANQQIDLVTIKTGIANWVYTEITEGLIEGDRIVTSVDRKGVEDGVQVVLE